MTSESMMIGTKSQPATTKTTGIMASASDFKPHLVFRSGHSQTLAAFFIFGKVLKESAVQHLVALPDGDQLVLHDDCPPEWKAGQPTALLVHGVCGTHASSYMSRIARRLNHRGIRTFRLDLRGCGAGATLARQSYYGGCSSDLHVALNDVVARCPGSAVTLVGFSLGGNICLKLLGENPAGIPEAVNQCAVVSPAIDLVATCAALKRGASRFYDRYFARLLWKQMQDRRRICPDMLLPPLTMSALEKPPPTARQFDDWFTAPLHGFRDSQHYYAESSAAPLLHRIAVPTFVLTAADDPIIPIAPFETAPRSAAVQLQITRFGGHMGYLSRRGADPDRHWMDWRVVEWITGSASR